MRQILLCRNSSSKCAMRWPTWRGECYPPPCCSTAAGWAQSTLWYPSFKSRPFSLFVWHAFPFLSFHCTVLRGTNSLASVCTSWCQSFWIVFCGWVSVLQILILPENGCVFQGKTRQETFLSICHSSYFLGQTVSRNLDKEAVYWNWTTVLINTFFKFFLKFSLRRLLLLYTCVLL